MSTLWTAAEAAEATGGTAIGDWSCTGLSIDTRSLAEGEMFVALKDQRDGHDFVAAALAKGAPAALVSHRPDGVAEDAPLLIVEDVLTALEDMARAARARGRAQVIGVTGSVGKTTTKEMLRAILGGQGQVHAAEKSFNNHWGVPLTLARMPREAEFAVIEIGMNHPGEIAPLAKLAQLDVAVVTIVAPAHLAAFESIEAIAVEKSAIIEGLKPGGTAVLNGDIETSHILVDAAKAAGAKICLFGHGEDAEFRLTNLRQQDQLSVAEATAGGTEFVYRIKSPGAHFAMNGLAALAAATEAGGKLGRAVSDLGQWQPVTGRGERGRVLLDPVNEALAFDLIDDSYNANPASIGAGLDMLAATTPKDGQGRVNQGRRIAVLGDMLELGPAESAMHAALADHPAVQNLDKIHTVGARMKHLHEALPEDIRGTWSETSADLAARIHHHIDAGDVVLVKGSLGIRLAVVVDAILKLGQAVDNETT
ncbi:UDP-N-acetylmuramoyl-tripeptide--D-alanyl-D-alanine ligase [Alphaproteobacteria bacterium KMM 3653]|uniref:UDP-N-acetylmuramoyl-tripeptide--D-alanyl-D-alanine ligase n=1 Tax=Harenicola maris TaxID=2841044 RepID=A0AAP2G312_9RHOB|nr:UDP-N-acetylmuramoyl-tripeptide--D-alanyl-D-alanine ligase [Harenicola maris]